MSELNAAQRAAVVHEQGPLLVLAGAGSGKTRVITQRIARLVARGTRPEAILAVSFTNKAAEEMRERMVPLIGADAASKLWLSTFHSFGVRFLGEESEALGLPGRFVVFDQGDSLGTVREVLRSLRRSAAVRKLDPAAILSRISQWKNDFVNPDQTKETDFEYDAVAREVYPRYESALRAMCALDFDDLVVAPVKVLRAREDVRAKWRGRFRHLLIDEFQDTSRSQLELVKLLANDLRNVCVVGDDDQAIYGWRGADVRNILDFDKTFAGTLVVKLEDNYRSRPPIIAVANAAIEQSKHARHGKVLRAVRAGGDKVRLCVVDDVEQEAKLVAAEIKELREQGRKPRDIAVLYRSNLQARAIEEELRACGHPYRLFGGTQFFDRKEVKDAAAYLRVIAMPRDEISLRRILNYPPRGIGDTTVERVEKFAKARHIPFADALRRIDEVHDVPDAARRSAHALDATLARARERFQSGRELAAATRAMLDEVGLRADIHDAAEGGVSGAKRWENVEQLIGSIGRYERLELHEKPSLASFLARITLRYSDEDEEDPGNKVTLSTLHGVKGLEFPVVFLIGCVEGQLPHSRTTDPKVSDSAPADVEEERRLFYVGVTRARDSLYLVRPKRRLVRGKPTALTPSRFLEGLPEEHTEVYERKLVVAMEASEIAASAAEILARLGVGSG